MLNRLSFIIFFLFISSGEVYSQFLNQKDLEKKRIELTKEIKNIQNLITSSKNEKKLVIENIDNLNYKLDLQNEVIKIINNELNMFHELIKLIAEDTANILFKIFKSLTNAIIHFCQLCVFFYCRCFLEVFIITDNSCNASLHHIKLCIGRMHSKHLVV